MRRERRSQAGSGKSKRLSERGLGDCSKVGLGKGVRGEFGGRRSARRTDGLEGLLFRGGAGE